VVRRRLCEVGGEADTRRLTEVTDDQRDGDGSYDHQQPVTERFDDGAGARLPTNPSAR
jgi:hypothetical protein